MTLQQGRNLPQCHFSCADACAAWVTKDGRRSNMGWSSSRKVGSAVLLFGKDCVEHLRGEEESVKVKHERENKACVGGHRNPNTAVTRNFSLRRLRWSSTHLSNKNNTGFESSRQHWHRERAGICPSFGPQDRRVSHFSCSLLMAAHGNWSHLQLAHWVVFSPCCLLWERLAALAARLVQSLVAPWEIQRQVYVDDPIFIAAGSREQRWRLFTVKTNKGPKVEWIGGEFSLLQDGVLVQLTDAKTQAAKAFAQKVVRGTSFRPFLPCDILASRFCIFVAWVPHCFG